MSGENLPGSFSSAVRKSSAIKVKPTSSEPSLPSTNGERLKPRGENRKLGSNSTWRTQSRQERSAPSTNWRDKSQHRVTSAWQNGASESGSAYQEGFMRHTSRGARKGPFGERQNKFGGDFLTSNDAASALPGALGDSRRKFGSNSSLASDCSTSSVQPWDSRKRFSKSRRKFGSGCSVTSDTSAVSDGGFGRGASFARGTRKSRNDWSRSTHRDAGGWSRLSCDYLKILSQKEVHEIVLEVTVNRSPFDAYLQKSPLPTDWVILILNIVSKICASEYEGNCSEFLYKICQSPFLDNLSSYLGDMTVETDAEAIEKLPMHDFCEFVSSLLDAWPMVAIQKNLKTLINKMKLAVNNFSLLGSPIKDDIRGKLETLVDAFDECKKMAEGKQQAKKQRRVKVEKIALDAPPDDFRRLSLYPTADDLLGTQRGFLRPNIIEGAYENVEHYLDVQFRLLREDFMDSVRSGIQKYLASKSEPGRKKFKFDGIRVYPETRLESWKQKSSSSKEVGIQLNFDPNERFCRTCDWAQNKRFMHGSLLLLTADDFKTFTCATVMERDVATLRNGRVLAALVEETPDFHRTFAKPFTMVESEVFFEPYFLILQALKKLDDQSFPMTDYIVKSQSITELPVYPQKGIVRGLYGISNRNSENADDTFWRLVTNDEGRFELGPEPMPEVSDSFELDEYQMEAYEAGMERDFSVIQGPPGTGKTFLGLKLVESILNECHQNKNKLPILVVCLTNHALDQFLERMLAFTNKVVRVGGQSRNENLSSRNLKCLRQALFWSLRSDDRSFESMTARIAREIKVLSQNIENIQKMKKYIETPVGILSTVLLKQVVDPSFKSVVENDETLMLWLLEVSECEAPTEDFFVNFGHLYENGIMDIENPEPMMAKKVERNTTFTLTSICEVNCLKSYSITLDGLEEKLRSATQQLNALIDDEESLLEKGWNSSVIYFEKNFLKNLIKHLNSKYHKLKANLETFVENPEAKVLTALYQDPRKLPSKSRWLIYWSWLARVQEKLLLEMGELEARHRAKVIQLEEYKMFEDLHIMKQADVVGMTTTGAARLSKLLALLKPAIVVVEEAAEVLEAHIVASLTKSCRHLILIGDHKQLRPSAAVYELSKYYNIDVSLFERVIKNGMHCPMLKVQHRMRPEIAALITPLIYPDLENHESVMQLEPIEGVKKNLFFLEHDRPESTSFDDTSKENIHEAEFVVKLAKYFIQQGYNPENITLLTFYAGQMLRIRNLMKRDNSLHDVKCVVVDKYQGEENSIIILSLVRSNQDGDIGFLSIENRVCVALSRAKNGFFMIGNMECLAKKKLWQKLRNTLMQTDAIGPELPLYCERHHKTTLVSKAEDFKLVRDGGCGAVCDMKMTCGHDCKRMCHPVCGDHESVNCEEPCIRLCPRYHECKKLCKEECDKCVTMVEKLLTCNHVAQVRCHEAENPYLCTEIVEDIRLSCDHLVMRKCHQNVEDVHCTTPCGKILRCGHTCTRLCHEDDPEHTEFLCKEKCDKCYEGCTKGHRCGKPCFQECGRCPHKEKVTLSCGHIMSLPCSSDLSLVMCMDSCLKTCPTCNLNCTKKCWENCRPCKNKVKKVIPTCGHEVDVNCSDQPDRKLCKENCTLMAPCGHKCRLTCGETCDSKGCTEWVTSAAKKPVCGHKKIFVLCGEKNTVSQLSPESFLANCREKCAAILECGDVCSGTCGQCWQGRLHQTCPKLCGRTFICGHKCKSPCEKVCPPCNEPCAYGCSHSKCNERCGIPCSPCKEPCDWKCKHTKCSRKCGDFCNRQPCYKPCELKLPCGHDCVGFCGEPCPPLCRFCNPEITNVKFGFENAPDARFVLMVDCDHVIESRALDQHFAAIFEKGKIVVRGCPLCGTPITKTLRYMNFVKRTYRQIAEVVTKNFEDLRSFDLKQMFLDWRKFPSQCSTIPVLLDFCKFCVNNLPDPSQKHAIFSSEVLSNYLYLFQTSKVFISEVRVFGSEPMHSVFFKKYVLPYLDTLIRRLLNSFSVNRQQMLDLNLELRRFQLMANYQCVYSKSLIRFERQDAEIPKICAEIREILFGFAKFTRNDEDKIQILFEKLRKRPLISSGTSWPKNELAQKKELPRIFDDLKAGSWYQCLNEHYYCVLTENTTDCPECVKKGTLATNESGRRRRRRGRR